MFITSTSFDVGGVTGLGPRWGRKVWKVPKPKQRKQMGSSLRNQSEFTPLSERSVEITERGGE